MTTEVITWGLKLVDVVRKLSPSVVCVARPLKMGRSKHSSTRVSDRSGYTTTVLKSLWACMKNTARTNNLISVSPAVKPADY